MKLKQIVLMKLNIQESMSKLSQLDFKPDLISGNMWITHTEKQRQNSVFVYNTIKQGSMIQSYHAT